MQSRLRYNWRIGRNHGVSTFTPAAARPLPLHSRGPSKTQPSVGVAEPCAAPRPPSRIDRQVRLGWVALDIADGPLLVVCVPHVGVKVVGGPKGAVALRSLLASVAVCRFQVATISDMETVPTLNKT